MKLNMHDVQMQRASGAPTADSVFLSLTTTLRVMCDVHTAIFFKVSFQPCMQPEAMLLVKFSI